jgi:hypothetical protein
MLTAKPIHWPCVKHEIEGLGLSIDCRDCLYCRALQTVPFTPSSAVITTAVNGLGWKEATGDDTLLDLVREGAEGREKVEEGSESPSRRRWKIKESKF